MHEQTFYFKREICVLKFTVEVSNLKNRAQKQYEDCFNTVFYKAKGCLT